MAALAIRNCRFPDDLIGPPWVSLSIDPAALSIVSCHRRPRLIKSHVSHRHLMHWPTDQLTAAQTAYPIVVKREAPAPQCTQTPT